MKPFFVGLTAVVALTSLAVTAKVNSEGNDFRSDLMAKADQSKKGVIVMLSERGKIAADAAYLLAEQTRQNPGFAPLLIAPEQERMPAYQKTLALKDESLPALIFFDKSGKELNRVTGTLPVSAKTFPIRSASK